MCGYTQFYPISAPCITRQRKLRNINDPFVPERALLSLKYPYYHSGSFLTTSCTESVLCTVFVSPVTGNTKTSDTYKFNIHQLNVHTHSGRWKGGIGAFTSRDRLEGARSESCSPSRAVGSWTGPPSSYPDTRRTGPPSSYPGTRRKRRKTKSRLLRAFPSGHPPTRAVPAIGW